MREKKNPDWKPPGAAVMILTSENFTQIVEEAQLLLVEFYTPWCSHCQQVVDSAHYKHIKSIAALLFVSFMA